MNELLNSMSTEEVGMMVKDTKHGLNVIKKDLNNSERGDYFDKFIEESCEILDWLYSKLSQKEQ